MKLITPRYGKIITRVRNRAWCAECKREIEEIDRAKAERQAELDRIKIEHEAERLAEIKRPHDRFVGMDLAKPGADQTVAWEATFGDMAAKTRPSLAQLQAVFDGYTGPEINNVPSRFFATDDVLELARLCFGVVRPQ